MDPRLCRILCVTRFLSHWKAVFEHDGELASDSVLFAHRSLALGGCRLECQINQFRRCVGAVEGARGAGGVPVLRGVGVDGMRGVGQVGGRGRGELGGD